MSKPKTKTNFCDQIKQRGKLPPKKQPTMDWKKPFIQDNLKTDDLGFDKQKEVKGTTEFVKQMNELKDAMREK